MGKSGFSNPTGADKGHESFGLECVLHLGLYRSRLPKPIFDGDEVSQIIAELMDETDTGL